MKHYRINKLAKRGGVVVKHKDILASNDAEALRRAQESEDCPICDVMQAGQKVGAVT